MGTCLSTTNIQRVKKRERMTQTRSLKAPNSCPINHLYEFYNIPISDDAEIYKCNICGETRKYREGFYHCCECNIDICKQCFENYM